MKKNKSIIELIIDTEDSNPDTITDSIKIQPSQILKKGEPWLRPTDKRPIVGKINENNLWIY